MWHRHLSVFQMPCGGATSPCVSDVRKWSGGNKRQEKKENFSVAVSRRPGPWWRGWRRRTTLYRAWWMDQPRPLATAAAPARLKTCVLLGTVRWTDHRLDHYPSNSHTVSYCLKPKAVWYHNHSVPLYIADSRSAGEEESWRGPSTHTDHSTSQPGENALRCSSSVVWL